MKQVHPLKLIALAFIVPVLAIVGGTWLQQFEEPVQAQQQNFGSMWVFCGTTTTCANTGKSGVQVVYGNVALNNASPSIATITGISRFTSSTSYLCTVTNTTTQTNSLKVANVSGSSFTITGPNTVTDVANYICVGN